MRYLGPVVALCSLGLTLPALYGQPQFESPELHPDGRVTLRFLAPEARQVRVRGSLSPAPTDLTRDESGLWSVTLGPLEPNIYEYVFLVDGAEVTDPRNPRVKVWRILNSMVEVPGQPPKPWELQDIPHGVVHRHWYRSRTLGVLRSYLVYTPPGYTAAGRERYPVVYLLHGSGDEETAWIEVGRAHFIADALLAQGRMKPALIVMPYGHAPRPAGTVAPDRHFNLRAIDRDLLEDVMAAVDRQYRTRPEADSRAIVGLSMGGGQSLYSGLSHLDRFRWIGGFSSSVSASEADLLLGRLKAEAARSNEAIRLLWIACGKSDFLLDRNREFEAWLTEAGIRHEYIETEGDHSWPVWRNYLVVFLGRLFGAEG